MSERIGINISATFICFIHTFALPLHGYGHGDIHDQIQDVTKKIAQDSTNAELYLHRGELHRYHRQWQAALEDYQIAEKLNPALNVVAFARGRLMLENGRYQEARCFLDQYLLMKPNDADALLVRAKVLRNLGKKLDAVQDFTRALEYTSQPKPEIYIERAQVLADQGDVHLAEAVRGLDEGLKVLGQIVTLQLYATDLDLRLENFDSALSRIQAISKQSPRKEKWLYRMGEILELAGRGTQAADKYEQALKCIEALPAHKRNARAVSELETKTELAISRLKDRSAKQANASK